MYKIIDSFIYKSEVNGRSKITECLGHINKTYLPNVITQINTQINIPITFQAFDLEAQSYITDTSINKTVDVHVNGESATTEDIVNGEGIIEFGSAEIGTFKIKVENAECEVVVNG